MLKKTLILFIILLSTTILYSQKVENDSISTYYLIRHAEKDRRNSTNMNPNITQSGLIRAENWSKIFDQLPIDAIYSTNYRRTLNTAFPTAKNNSPIIKTYHPFKIDMRQFLKTPKVRVY